MKSSSKIAIFSLLAWAAIGAIAGILFAPDKGSVTRTKLRHKAEDISDNLSDKYSYLKDEVKNMRNKMKTNKHETVEVNPE